MQATLDDCYVVVIRDTEANGDTRILRERELVTCPTYEEALWVKRECTNARRSCVIRFIRPAGGGD